MIEIHDIHQNELSIFTSLNESQLFHYYEPQPGIFLAESPKVITRALDKGYEPLALLCSTKELTTEVDLIARISNYPSTKNDNHSQGNPVIYHGSEDILKDLTGFALTRGMICAMRRKTLPTISNICKNARRIAVLDDVVNPTNVGAIFRSAAALHMDAVVLSKGCSDPLYRRALRVSMGCVLQIPYTIEEHWIDQLKKEDFRIAAMALTDQSVSIDYEPLHQEERLAIVLGNEGYGLSNHTLSQCDYTIKIPMSHDVDSLNVAAASAVAFWELAH